MRYHRLADMAYRILGVSCFFSSSQLNRLIALFLESYYQWRPDETGMNGVDADIVFSVSNASILAMTRLAAFVA